MCCDLLRTGSCDKYFLILRGRTKWDGIAKHPEKMEDVLTSKQPLDEIEKLTFFLIMALPGQKTGWHHYCYNASRFPCEMGECMRADTHPNNYYLCKACCNRAWFDSKIYTFKLDDLQRQCAQKRMKLTEPLEVHTEMRKKVWKEFRKRGGQIHVLAVRKDLPTIVKFSSTTCCVTYPAHLIATQLRGTLRAQERANALSDPIEDPWKSEDE